MALLALPRLDFSAHLHHKLQLAPGYWRGVVEKPSCEFVNYYYFLSVSGETNEMGKLDAMRATLEDSVASRFTTAPLTFLDF